MRMTANQKRKFEYAYDQAMMVAVKDMKDYKKEMIGILENHDFKSKLNFGDFAREAFLHNIQKFHDHYYSLEAATQSFKDIINNRP